MVGLVCTILVRGGVWREDAAFFALAPSIFRVMVLPALPPDFGDKPLWVSLHDNPLSLRGSRNTRSHDIRLNTELAKKPPECLGYVLVHEMTHLLEPFHNLRFKVLMDHFTPD